MHHTRAMVRVLLLVLLAACAEAPLDLDEPQDATEGGGKADGAACTTAKCGNPEAAHILFPGNEACGGGCERHLAGDDLYIPPRGGKPWGDTFELGSASAVTLSGFSSGRIALLRRLGLVGDGEHAVMLDPSWNDGARDFLGRGPERGEDIVRAWLLADPWRTFTLIYSTRSTGWASYAGLLESDVAAQVKVCTVSQSHLHVPRVPAIRDALVDPVAWDNGTCRWGDVP